MDEPTIVTLADPEACAVSAAERIVEILDVAIDDHGEAHWATTGGSAPAGIYRALAGSALRDEIDWRKVRLWWTDERFVPHDHPLSNAKIAFDQLLEDTALVVHVAADRINDARHEIAPQLHLDVDRGEGVVDGVAPRDGNLMSAARPLRRRSLPLGGTARSAKGAA